MLGPLPMLWLHLGAPLDASKWSESQSKRAVSIWRKAGLWDGGMSVAELSGPAASRCVSGLGRSGHHSELMVEKCFGTFSEWHEQAEEISCASVGAASETRHGFLWQGLN